MYVSLRPGKSHLDVPHVAFRKHLGRFFIDQPPVRDQNDRQAATVDVVHDLEQIPTHQRFAAGERHVLQFGFFEDPVDESAYLLRRELVSGAGRFTPPGVVAIQALLIAARSKLQCKRPQFQHRHSPKPSIPVTFKKTEGVKFASTPKNWIRIPGNANSAARPPLSAMKTR